MSTRTTMARRLDHVYDPTYTVSGARDHQRNVQSSFSSQFQRVPDDKNMFSASTHYPAHTYKFKASEDVPGHVYQGHRAPEAPQVGASLESLVTGKHLYKHYRRPHVPMLDKVEMYKTATKGDPTTAAESKDMTGADKAHDVAIQTIFRETEAQTDPYTPDYVIAPGDEPEVLALMGLTFQRGLPPGLAEVEMVERARKNRDFESRLPPATDEANFELRKRLMEIHEREQWNDREREIDNLQNERLRLLEAALRQRDREKTEEMEKRVESLRQHRVTSKDLAIEKIQRRRIKELRKLSKARRAADVTLKPSDIIQEMSEPASERMFPLTRKGTLRHSPIAIPDDVTGLETVATDQFASTIPRSLMKSTATKPLAHQTSQQLRKKMEQTSHLDRVGVTIRRSKGEEVQTSKVAMPSWRRRREKVVRPPTPHVEVQSPEKLRREAAIVLLQRLLRGRAVQNMMFEGKERRKALIRELRVVMMRQQETEDLEFKASRDRALRGAVDTAGGEVVAATLDYLSKELVRQAEQSKVKQFVRVATAERQRREQLESGRREKEVQQLQLDEEIERQVGKVMQESGEGYSREMIREMIGKAADDIATREGVVHTAALGPLLDQLEQRFSSDGLVVKNLVADFLLPEVEREKQRRQVALEERRFVIAAKEAISQGLKGSFC